jgi:hypothetical protein
MTMQQSLLAPATCFKSNISHFGDHNLYRFALALTNTSELAVAKIEMLLTGQFSYGNQKIRLFNCGWNSTGGPKRGWIHRWWEANAHHLVPETAGAEEWDRVLPQYKIGGYWHDAWKHSLNII